MGSALGGGREALSEEKTAGHLGETSGWMRKGAPGQSRPTRRGGAGARGGLPSLRRASGGPAPSQRPREDGAPSVSPGRAAPRGAHRELQRARGGARGGGGGGAGGGGSRARRGRAGPGGARPAAAESPRGRTRAASRAWTRVGVGRDQGRELQAPAGPAGRRRGPLSGTRGRGAGEGSVRGPRTQRTPRSPPRPRSSGACRGPGSSRRPRRKQVGRAGPGGVLGVLALPGDSPPGAAGTQTPRGAGVGSEAGSPALRLCVAGGPGGSGVPGCPRAPTLSGAPACSPACALGALGTEPLPLGRGSWSGEQTWHLN